jgi:hypothetical protein
MDKKQGSRWNRLQSGQAMMEYWPTIPAAIMIMIAGGALVHMLNGAFSKTTDALYRAGLNSEICMTTSETVDGTDEAVMNDHHIQVSATVYDPGTDTTTVTYTVTSGASPSISHWVLGIPKSIAANIIDESEAWEWTDSDPTTGVAGIKFDTGYESEANTEEPKDKEPKDTGKPPKKTKSIALNTYDFSVMAELLPTGETRDIVLVLSGQYDFDPVTVSVKAGTDTYTSTITAPVGAPQAGESSGDNFLDQLNQFNDDAGCGA